MGMTAVGGGKQTQSVTPLLINFVGPFHHRGPSQVDISRCGSDVITVGDNANPVIHPAAHDGTDRAHGCDVPTLGFATLQTAFDGFGNRDCLSYGEANGGVNADAFVGSFFNSGYAGSADGDFNLHIVSQSGETAGLFEQHLGISIIFSGSLNGKAALFALVFIINRLEQFSTLDSHFLI